MTPVVNLAVPAILDLPSFVINLNFKSSGPSKLFLDRANGEVGIVNVNPPSMLSVAQFPDDEPLCFDLKGASAAAWRSRCKKLSLLFQDLQLDLEFTSADVARDFLRIVEDITTCAQNHYFWSHEVPTGVKFVHDEFDMVRMGLTGRAPQDWTLASRDSEWPRLRETGEWSDFTIIAEGKAFAVHRVKLCKESVYFKAVCAGSFTESKTQQIELPESAEVIGVLLDELYNTYNSTTGSIFTNFALRPELEKERSIAKLEEVFVACHKYNLEHIKNKVAVAIIDRLPFIKDPLIVIELAADIFHDEFPYVDVGLREAVIRNIEALFPTILKDEDAWEELTDNKTVLKALHLRQFRMQKE